MAMTDINKMIKSNAPHTSGGDFADVLERIEAMRSAPEQETYVEDFAQKNAAQGVVNVIGKMAKAVAIFAAVIIGVGVIVLGISAFGGAFVAQESSEPAYYEDVCASEISDAELWEEGTVSESDVPSDSDLWDIEEEGVTE
ncbi:MAG: hypothetical protein IJP17_04455 [Clostridia bacterium]|nr:hypothetical protein [Clostridia bacterium]